MNNLAQISKILKQTWQLSYEPISVRFSDSISANISCKPDGSFYCDTACTALCRCFKQNKVLVIAPENNCQNVPAQPCAGANFFLKLSQMPIPEEEARQVYVETEQVFRDEQICQNFLQKISTSPISIKEKFIVLSPLSQEIGDSQIIIFLVNASQASKILGLSVCQNYQAPEIISAAPTCIALYLPLINNRIHVNFIDYYDRYHQGKQKNGELIWQENELVISMTFELLQVMLKDINYSPHGNFQPKLEPRTFDIIR